METTEIKGEIEAKRGIVPSEPSVTTLYQISSRRRGDGMSQFEPTSDYFMAKQEAQTELTKLQRENSDLRYSLERAEVIQIGTNFYETTSTSGGVVLASPNEVPQYAGQEKLVQVTGLDRIIDPNPLTVTDAQGKVKVLSFDVEANGLYGKPFAVGATVTDDNGELSRYVARCPIEGDVNSWVAQNVLPAIKDIPETHSFGEMLRTFYQFYMKHRYEADIVAHVAHPVETGFLRQVAEQDLEERAFNMPFPLVDVATVLRVRGEDPNSVRTYLEKKGLNVDFDGSEHHPVYDAKAAEVVYRHLME